ncbi:unnamed protein product [Parajaminaea phylloscopi]
MCIAAWRRRLSWWVVLLHWVCCLCTFPPALAVNAAAAAAAASEAETPHRLALFVSKQNITFHGQTTEVVVFNNSYPGPTIRIRAGQLYLINVTNSMHDANTTVHWHGLSQRLNPAADGTHQSQWPIAPGRWFEYELRPLEEDVGTRFYHSHTELQSVTAHAPLVVESGRGALPFHYDCEHILVLSDWYHAPGEKILRGLWGDPFVWAGSADLTTVNGKGFTGNRTFSAQEQPHIIDVEYDKVYYLRWIGAQALMYYSIVVADHPNHFLVEVDGTDIKPTKLSVLELASGQRYGSLLHTKSRSDVERDAAQSKDPTTRRGCYWIRIESQWRHPATNGWAVLRYPAAEGCGTGDWTPPLANNSETMIPRSKLGWISHELEPLDNSYAMPADERVSRRLVIDTQQTHRAANSKGIVWRESGIVYNETSQSRPPYLLELYQGLRERPSWLRAMENRLRPGWDDQSETYVAQGGEVLDIVIVNRPSKLSGHVEVHSWHLHSRKFHHLASGPGSFSDAALARARGQGYRRPVPRDTVAVWPEPGSTLNESDTLLPEESGGWTVLRYEATQAQAGVWLLHCHLVFHMVMGMSSTFVVAPDALPSKFSGDPAYFQFGTNVRSPYTYSQSL